MAVPPVIGVYVYKGGSWQRANAGTPTGYSGPQVRQAGVWNNCIRVRARASSVWQYCWVNIDGEINITTQDNTSIDFSFDPPYSARVDYWINDDGTVDVRADPGSYPTRTEVSSWRNYDCGRTYQYRFIENGPDLWTYHNTLNTWADISGDPAFGVSITFAGDASCSMTVGIREKVSAPAGGHDSANFYADVSAGLGG